MLTSSMHPEDIKAVLRKRFGSLRAFVESEGLPSRGVSDMLRGRRCKRVRQAVERVLQEQTSESTKAALSSRAA